MKAPSPRTDWHRISVAPRHACALASGGRAYCWGNDADGALGIGPTRHGMDEDMPVTEVATDHRFGQIVTGAVRTCAIDNLLALYCWGRVPEAAPDDRCPESNGVATGDCTTHPVAVYPGKDFWAIAIGESHQCGILNGTSIVCWGQNETGQLGNGGRGDSTVPVTVSGSALSSLRRGAIDAQGWLVWLLRRASVAVVFAIPLLLFARFLRRWWAAGEAARSRAPAEPARREKLGAVAACVCMAIAWTLILAFLFAVPSNARGDVAYGLVMIGFLVTGGIALVLAVIAATVALVVLRRHPQLRTARVALALASLILLGGIFEVFVTLN